MFAYFTNPFELLVLLIGGGLYFGTWLLVVVTCIVVLKNRRNWCGGTAAAVGLRCPQCQEAAPLRARFCPGCGNRLQA
jgi:hypothetical protein